jgi:hypothetical protein
MTIEVPATTVVSHPVRQWYRDPVSCLQATLATVLLHWGEDPLPVLGLGWEFLYLPGDTRPEEFYYPCRHDGDVAHSIAPYHPFHSGWWRPVSGEEPLLEVAERLERDELVIAAVDNYYLPFRPAFRDVHAAHLLVVCGMDSDKGEIRVSDAMPPAFQGGIPVDDFLRGWSSGNPPDVQDDFFSDAVIGRRCLDVRASVPLMPVGRDLLRSALEANLRGFDGRDGAGDGRAALSGLAGLRCYLDELIRKSRAGDTRVLAELYPFSWGMQAQSYLHGELLGTLGEDWGIPVLREAGRAVASVSYAWTGLRMTGAHGRGDPVAAAPVLAGYARRLRHSYECAVEAVGRVLDAL